MPGQIRTAKIVFYDEEGVAVAGYKVLPTLVEWEQQSDPMPIYTTSGQHVHTTLSGSNVTLKIEALVDSVILERKSGSQ
jgi:hypothetical protein